MLHVPALVRDGRGRRKSNPVSSRTYKRTISEHSRSRNLEHGSCISADRTAHAVSPQAKEGLSGPPGHWLGIGHRVDRSRLRNLSRFGEERILGGGVGFHYSELVNELTFSNLAL